MDCPDLYFARNIDMELSSGMWLYITAAEQSNADTTEVNGDDDDAIADVEPVGE